jgi:hypothetical protein
MRRVSSFNKVVAVAVMINTRLNILKDNDIIVS